MGNPQMRTNAKRQFLATTLIKAEGIRASVFRLGDAASCAVTGQTTPAGYYNLERMLKILKSKGAQIGVCGTCMDGRGIKAEMLADGSHRSTMDDLRLGAPKPTRSWSSKPRPQISGGLKNSSGTVHQIFSGSSKPLRGHLEEADGHAATSVLGCPSHRPDNHADLQSITGLEESHSGARRSNRGSRRVSSRAAASPK